MVPLYMAIVVLAYIGVVKCNNTVYSLITNSNIITEDTVIYLHSNISIDISKLQYLPKVIIGQNNNQQFVINTYNDYFIFARNSFDINIVNLNVSFLLYNTEINGHGRFIVFFNDINCEPKLIFNKFWKNDILKLVLVCYERLESDNYTIYTANAFDLTNKCGKNFSNYNISDNVVFYEIPKSFYGCDFIVNHFKLFLPMVSSPSATNPGIALQIVKIFETSLKFRVKYIEDNFDMEYMYGKKTTLQEQAVYSR